MEYKLRNGKIVNIRKSRVEDAQEIINVGTMPKALKYLDGTFADEYKMVKFL